MQKPLTKMEIKTLARLLKRLPQIPDIPKKIFTPLMSKNVPVTTELALIQGKKVLLIYRDDKYFKGWHFPGSLMSPRETFLMTCQRIARVEVGLKIKNSKLLSARRVVIYSGRRFKCVSIFFSCATLKIARRGAWFAKMPKDIIPEHRKLWQIIKPLLLGKSMPNIDFITDIHYNEIH